MKGSIETSHTFISALLRTFISSSTLYRLLSLKFSSSACHCIWKWCSWWKLKQLYRKVSYMFNFVLFGKPIHTISSLMAFSSSRKCWNSRYPVGRGLLWQETAQGRPTQTEESLQTESFLHAPPTEKETQGSDKNRDRVGDKCGNIWQMRSKYSRARWAVDDSGFKGTYQTQESMCINNNCHLLTTHYVHIQ